MQDAIHNFFGLTYSNYLVLNRTLLQSMPDEWQEKFVAMLNEMRESFSHVQQAESFDVHAATEVEVSELTKEQRKAAGIAVKHLAAGSKYWDKDANEMESWQRVLVRCDDPVPPYNRGRTIIEPKLPAGVSL